MTRRRTRTAVLDGVVHGTYTGYARGCGCGRCRAANTAHHAAYRQGVRGRRGRPPRSAKARVPTDAQRTAFQGSPYDSEKAKRNHKHRPRAPLTDAERAVLAELLGQRR